LLLGISQLYIFFKSRKSGSNNISLKLVMKPLHEFNEIDCKTDKKVLQCRAYWPHNPAINRYCYY
jgi:hypothetical protein